MLLYGVVCVILRLAVLVQCRLETDGHTLDDSIYRASTAWRGKTTFSLPKIRGRRVRPHLDPRMLLIIELAYSIRYLKE